MKSELNNYGITNADGTPKNKYDESKTSSDNENARYSEENSLRAQGESFRVPETFDDLNKDVGSDKNAEKNSDSAASVAAITKTVGGNIGALSAVIATAVVAAIVIVSVFITAFSISVSLVMASTDSLVFKVEMTGAKEEDFKNPIFAILTSENGGYFEQEIQSDTLYITFENLEKNTEYVIHIKNPEKVLFEKSYCTAAEPVETGYIFASNEKSEVIVSVKDVNLKQGEYYTLTAKNEKGNVVFVKDNDEQFAEYKFTAFETKRLFFSLSVNGKVCAFYQFELKASPEEYDFNNPVWTWTKVWTASVSFESINGGEPLVIEASVERKVIEPTCENYGRYVYVAFAEYNGQSYTDSQEEIISAIGHDFGEPEFEWTQSPTGGYTVVAIFTCNNDQSHVEKVDATVTIEDNVFVATVEFNGTIYTDERGM